MRLSNKMIFSNNSTPSSRLDFWVGVGGVVVGIAAGILAGARPLELCLVLGAGIVLIYFFADFERAVLGLLLLRSSLDMFSVQKIPAAFAIGIDALTLLYVLALLLTRQTVRTDGFWWFFAGWLMLQGLWPVLCALGGLGLGPSYLPVNIIEWIRLFSLLIVYLLVMQLKDRLHPKKIISLLFICLIPPVTVALMQIFLPNSLLPPLLMADVQRIRGTFTHPSLLASYLFFFIGLVYWKLRWAQYRWPWALLLSLLAFVFVGTKSLSSLAMLCTFVLVLIAPRLNLPKLIGGILLLVLILGLFASTPYGQERLNSIANIPLINPDMEVSQAVLMSRVDDNSFNWRLAQWTYLLQAWQQFPILGYGLGTSIYVSTHPVPPHDAYIQALVEEGIVGLGLFLIFLIAMIVRLVQLLLWQAPPNSAQHDLCFTLLAIVLALPVGMLTDNIWGHTALFFYFWSVFAIAGWNWNDSVTQPKIPINLKTSQNEN